MVVHQRVQEEYDPPDKQGQQLKMQVPVLFQKNDHPYHCWFRQVKDKYLGHMQAIEQAQPNL